MNKIFLVLTLCLLAFADTAGHAQQSLEAQNVAEKVSLNNGFYLILEEQTVPEKFEKSADDEVIVTYTLEHLGVNGQPARHFRIKNKPNVAFSLDAKPEVGDKIEGKTTLNVVLGEGNAKEFQQFTADNIDRGVAIIIGGKVVTAHKIRTEIVGGKIQITRCGDDACEQLYLWIKDCVAK
jgi:preprotein translocase subunit SecD